MVPDPSSNHMMLQYFSCPSESLKGIKLIGAVFRKMFLFFCFPSQDIQGAVLITLFLSLVIARNAALVSKHYSRSPFSSVPVCLWIQCRVKFQSAFPVICQFYWTTPLMSIKFCSFARGLPNAQIPAQIEIY